MEYRKLIKFGNSSYVISVPKTWMTKNKLGKGDLVYLSENGNSELMITAANNTDERVKLQEATINVDGKSFSDIKREIDSSYIRNTHIITIQGKQLDKKVREIRKYISNLIALEIVEQNREKIVAKDYLNMKKISLFQTVKKIDSIIDSMLNDAKLTFQTDSYHSIMVRDEDINKLVNMIFRVSRYVMKKPHLVTHSGFTASDFFKYFQVADNLEKIGDEAKRLSRYMRALNVDEATKQAVTNIFEEIHILYRDVMTSFYDHDAERAIELATNDHSIRERCDSLASTNGNAVHLYTISEKLKILDYYIHSIGREVYQ